MEYDDQYRYYPNQKSSRKTLECHEVNIQGILNLGKNNPVRILNLDHNFYWGHFSIFIIL